MFKEAASVCPADHPDKGVLEEHGQDLSVRMVYLESLGGQPATVPLEDHIVPAELSMDLSMAAPPGEEQVETLVAGTGVSGASAEMTEQGYQLVAALRNDAEMTTFIRRFLEASNLGILGNADADLNALASRYSGTCGVQSLDRLGDELRTAAWVAPLDRKDKLEVAVAFETQGKELEKSGHAQDAIQKYSNAIVFFQHVLKHDDRAKNAKICEMIRKRVEDLEVSIARLRLSGAS